MSLKNKGTNHDPNAFPTQQLLVLAICRFSEPIAFNSILAYTFVMVRDLEVDAQDASYYAGLLVSAYAVGEAITSMGWGALSDRVGRKPVVLIGLVGVAISSLIFGLAKQYWVALLARFVGGALNGNVSVMQTMVAEMVRLPEHEPIAYAVQPFVWALGGIIGSAMGGFLAQPSEFYPSLFPRDGLFGRYPYLLPNLVSVVVVITAVLQGLVFLKETNVRVNGTNILQNDQSVAVADDDEPVDEETSLLQPSRIRAARHRASSSSFNDSRPRFVESSLPLAIEHDFIDLRRSSFGTVHSIQVPQGPLYSSGTDSDTSTAEPRQFKGKTFNFTVIMLIVTILISAYHQMAAGSLLPTHLLDDPKRPTGQLDLRGGLGYDVHDVGMYLAVNGVLALFIQAVIFPVFVKRVGIWHSFMFMIVLYPTAYVIMPFLSILPQPLTSAGIYLSLFLQSFYGMIVGPVNLILLKNATPSPLVLGKVNGLAMSGACLARTIGPPLVGVIYSLAGSGAAWASCAGVALLGVLQIYWVPRNQFQADEVVVVDNTLIKQATDNSYVGVVEGGSVRGRT